MNLLKKNGPRNIKTISNRYSLENSIGTQYDDNFTVEDHIPNTNELDNVSDTCSVSNARLQTHGQHQHGTTPRSHGTKRP